MPQRSEPKQPTETAVIIPVAAAEHVVGTHRRELDIAASWGVPAHVTVIYPFVPPSALDEGTLRRLARAVASVARFQCVFARCAWFEEDVVWLAPEPDQPFRDLTVAVWSEFPDCPPYGGAYPDIVPHLTIGDTNLASTQRMRAAEAAVTRRLPVRATIDHADLIAGTNAPDSWRTLATLPLGDGRDR